MRGNLKLFDIPRLTFLFEFYSFGIFHVVEHQSCYAIFSIIKQRCNGCQWHVNRRRHCRHWQIGVERACLWYIFLGFMFVMVCGMQSGVRNVEQRPPYCASCEDVGWHSSSNEEPSNEKTVDDEALEARKSDDFAPSLKLCGPLFSIGSVPYQVWDIIRVWYFQKAIK